jgi:HK97 family phage major capsid protein
MEKTETLREAERRLRGEGHSRTAAAKLAADLQKQRQEKYAMSMQRIREQIVLLQEGQERLNKKGFMNETERELHGKMSEEIQRLRMELPVGGGPVTLQGPGSGSRALSGHNGGTGGFENVGEILQALYKRSKGEGMDPRLEPLQVRAGINESTPSQGGFAVPEQLIYRSFTENLQDTVLLQLCDKVPMTTDKLGIPIFGDDNHSTSAPFGIQWDQVPESGDFGAFQSVPFKKLALQAYKSGALFSASNEWLSDADPAMRARLETIFQSSLRWYCESKLWNGTGSGQALGALVGDGALSITKETGQTADTILTENIVKMWARLRPGSHNRAIWACNPGCFPMLATLSISVGVGGNSVGLLQPSGIAGAPATSILGRPLYLSEHLPALGDAGDICLLDPMLYVLGDRKQIIVDASPHIRFQYDETAFRVQARFDGQPALSSVLTPANGDTCAWLVKIAAR